MLDTSVLLQNTLSLLPTHLVVVNLDERLHDPIEEMAAFLPSFGVTILHVHEGAHATVPVEPLNEAQVIRLLPEVAFPDLEDPFAWAVASYRLHRPAALHAIRTALKSWADERRQERTVFLFAGAPRTPVEAAFLAELPLDAAALFFRRTGALPLALRFMIAPRRPFEGGADMGVAHVLAALEQTYFSLPEISADGDAGAAAASPYDTTVWVDGAEGTEVVHFLRDVVRLHGEENARLAGNFPPPGDGGLAVPSALDLAMRAEADHRALDWLALCAVPHAPRLWTHGLPALGAAIDMRHDRRRAKEPLVAIGRYERERDWNGNLVVQTYLSQVEHPPAAYRDIATGDFPYRVTDEDRASKLETSRRLSEHGQFERAAELAAELLEDDPHHRLLNRMLGTDLFVAGDRRRAGEVLRRCIALTEIDPSLEEAQRAAEIATLYHLLSDYDAAISGYERAIAADPLNAHAYEGLVLIHRGRGDEALADHWLQAARRRDLPLPIVLGDQEVEEAHETVEAKREKATRSRWWRFLRG
jgi:hypothetical protein